MTTPKHINENSSITDIIEAAGCENPLKKFEGWTPQEMLEFLKEKVQTAEKMMEEIRLRRSKGESDVDIMFDTKLLKKSKNGRKALKILRKSSSEG
jgi:hypothetical protein